MYVARKNNIAIQTCTVFSVWCICFCNNNSSPSLISANPWQLTATNFCQYFFSLKDRTTATAKWNTSRQVPGAPPLPQFSHFLGNQQTIMAAPSHPSISAIFWQLTAAYESSFSPPVSASSWQLSIAPDSPSYPPIFFILWPLSIAPRVSTIPPFPSHSSPPIPAITCHLAAVCGIPFHPPISFG